MGSCEAISQALYFESLKFIEAIDVALIRLLMILFVMTFEYFLFDIIPHSGKYSVSC